MLSISRERNLPFVNASYCSTDILCKISSIQLKTMAHTHDTHTHKSNKRQNNNVRPISGKKQWRSNRMGLHWDYGAEMVLWRKYPCLDVR